MCWPSVLLFLMVFAKATVTSLKKTQKKACIFDLHAELKAKKDRPTAHHSVQSAALAFDPLFNVPELREHFVLDEG